MPKKNIKKNLSFYDHFEELRKRIFIIIIFLITISVIIFSFFDKFNLYHIFTAPLEKIKQKLYFNNLLDPFMVRMKISFILGIILTIPVFFYHALKFVFPALKNKEKEVVFWIVLTISILFFSGAYFAYALILPNSINFLIHFAPNTIAPLLGIKDYINLYLGFILTTGLIFLSPILILLLTRLNIIKPQFLAKHIPESFIIIFIVAAVVAPTTDLFSQSLLAIPLFLLYLISLLVSYLFRPNK